MARPMPCTQSSRATTRVLTVRFAGAEDGLRSSAKNLQLLSAQKHFFRPVKLPPSLMPSLNPSGSTSAATAIPTDDQVLAESARLANQLADALSEIRNGTEGQSQLELVIRNNGIITHLSTEFGSLEKMWMRLGGRIGGLGPGAPLQHAHVRSTASLTATSARCAGCAFFRGPGNLARAAQSWSSNGPSRIPPCTAHRVQPRC